jgi:hypothetical protein
MAPKQAKCARVASGDSCGQISTFINIVLTPLGNICLDSTSGWRELGDGHVGYLVQQILDGKCGNTTLARPSIRCDDTGPMVSPTDGLLLLENGKRFIAALLRVRDNHLPEGYDPMLASSNTDTAARPSYPTWFQGYVQSIFEHGLHVDHKKAPNPTDNAAHIAMQVWSHDASQNKFCESSVSDKIMAYEKILAQVGNDHVKAETMIREITGQRVTALRWKQFSMNLDPNFKDFLKDAKYITQAMILQNNYYTGAGEAKKFRLDFYHCKLSAEWLKDRMEIRDVSAADFVSKFCRVAKSLQSWSSLTTKKSGVVATSFAAYNRVIDMLRTDGGRQKMLLCLEQKVSIEAGIPECKVVLDEMEKVKAGMDMRARGLTPTADVATTAASPGGVDANGVFAGNTDALDLMDADGCGDSAIDSGRAATKIIDPAIARATELAEKERVHVNIHTDLKKFEEDCRTRLFPSHAVVSIIDCPSSKVALVKQLMDMLKPLPVDNSIIVECGRRWEFIQVVMEEMKLMFPKRSCYVIQISTSLEQSKRNQPTYACVLPSNAKSLPLSSLVVHGCRAKPSEKLRLKFPPTPA